MKEIGNCHKLTNGEKARYHKVQNNETVVEISTSPIAPHYLMALICD